MGGMVIGWMEVGREGGDEGGEGVGGLGGGRGGCGVVVGWWEVVGGCRDSGCGLLAVLSLTG